MQGMTRVCFAAKLPEYTGQPPARPTLQAAPRPAPECLALKAHVLQHRQRQVPQPIQLVLVRELLKVVQAGDGGRQGLHTKGGCGAAAGWLAWDAWRPNSPSSAAGKQQVHPPNHPPAAP